MIEETGWLIELKPSVVTEPTWYGDDDSGVLGWTTDNLKAVRFARKEDAEAVIRLEGFTEAFASDHMWCDYLSQMGSAAEMGMEQAMIAKTPIIDAAVRAGCTPWHEQDCSYPFCDCVPVVPDMIRTALRVAFPRDPTPETVEAMAGAAYHRWFGEYAQPKWGEAVISKAMWRAASIAAYRVQPIWQELWRDEP